MLEEIDQGKLVTAIYICPYACMPLTSLGRIIKGSLWPNNLEKKG